MVNSTPTKFLLFSVLRVSFPQLLLQLLLLLLVPCIAGGISACPPGRHVACA